tara:strand:+ start:1162 stop:1341 length:180 start_codon:yes stop_codon:yes gene_type:complete
MKVGDVVQSVKPYHKDKKIGIVVNVGYSKLYDWNHVIILWSNGRKEILPDYHVLRLSCK